MVKRISVSHFTLHASLKRDMAKIDVIGRIVKHLPKREFNGGRGEKVIKFFDKFVSVPENRLIIGVSALATQPFMDLFNKDVDEKTRVVSCARTIAKTVSGTVVGVTVRAGLIKLTRNYSKVGGSEIKNIKKIFTPSNALSDKTHAYKQYQNTMGTLLAVVAMLFTNFLIDATFTTFLTNKLMKRFGVANSKEVRNEKS